MTKFKVGDLVLHTDLNGNDPYNRDARDKVVFTIGSLHGDGIDAFLIPVTSGSSHHCNITGGSGYYMPLRCLVYALPQVLTCVKDMEALYG